ncbi:hypothetical protein FFONT_0234 [Fervidicoccus fontis Kam940]|uniref:Uncharacterized protein n=1 Tax=Fervidicoccus fontis (strain DSM 19380 / JCM 18336 / VKM B-2539 / Kam940) TaxID=1163730 RepID=H9ZZR8_FERFK|nr:hypothetical protein FFONT_0234 [Fervidicoccus fontis Kam940]
MNPEKRFTSRLENSKHRASLSLMLFMESFFSKDHSYQLNEEVMLEGA